MLDSRKWLLGSVVALGLVGCSECSHEEDAHSHGDHAAHAANATLTLNEGEKWQTDAPLRESMTRIRDQVQAAVPAIHDESFTPAQYAALGAAIDKEISTIFANCKLPPAADAQLHILLAGLTSGAAGMKKPGAPMASVVEVVEGLASYGEFFDHPGFQPITH